MIGFLVGNSLANDSLSHFADSLIEVSIRFEFIEDGTASLNELMGAFTSHESACTPILAFGLISSGI